MSDQSTCTNSEKQSWAAITLSKGQVAIVDADDYEWLSQWTWHATKFKRMAREGYYATRTQIIGSGAKTRKKRCVYMHRVILAAEAGQMVDHKDGDTLNNRRSNLRLCTKAQNAMNAQKNGGRKYTSRYKGVSYTRHGKYKRRWIASIKVGGKHVFVGRFHTEEEAAMAYDAAAKSHFGEFAKPNF